MDTAVLFLAIMTATMFAVTFNAWRLGNEKRGVVLLGAVGGLWPGVGTVLGLGMAALAAAMDRRHGGLMAIMRWVST